MEKLLPKCPQSVQACLNNNTPTSLSFTSARNEWKLAKRYVVYNINVQVIYDKYNILDEEIAFALAYCMEKAHVYKDRTLKDGPLYAMATLPKTISPNASIIAASLSS